MVSSIQAETKEAKVYVGVRGPFPDLILHRTHQLFHAGKYTIFCRKQVGRRAAASRCCDEICDRVTVSRSYFVWIVGRLVLTVVIRVGR